jgi:hypothetical protein
MSKRRITRSNLALTWKETEAIRKAIVSRVKVSEEAGEYLIDRGLPCADVSEDQKELRELYSRVVSFQSLFL